MAEIKCINWRKTEFLFVIFFENKKIDRGGKRYVNFGGKWSRPAELYDSQAHRFKRESGIVKNY